MCRRRRSSAYKNTLELEESGRRLRSLTKVTNNKGPRMEPWGTPEDTGEGGEIALPMRTHYDRSER